MDSISKAKHKRRHCLDQRVRERAVEITGLSTIPDYKKTDGEPLQDCVAAVVKKQNRVGCRRSQLVYGAYGIVLCCVGFYFALRMGFIFV